MIITVEKARSKLKSFMIIVYSNLEVTKYMKLPEFIDKCYEDKLEGIVEREKEACKAVLKLMETDYPDPIKEYFADTGERYAMTNNNAECQRFLLNYFKWLSYEADEKPTVDEIIKEKAEESVKTITEKTIIVIEKIPAKLPEIKLPEIKLPGLKLPEFGIGKYIFLLIIIIFGLFALGYSGLGGIAQREHGRRR